jgi:hypothetical protein
MNTFSVTAIVTFAILGGLTLLLLRKRGMGRRGLMQYAMALSLPLLVFYAVQAGALPLVRHTLLSKSLTWGGILIFVLYCSIRIKAWPAFVFFFLGATSIWLSLPVLISYTSLFASFIWVILFGKLDKTTPGHHNNHHASEST